MANGVKIRILTPARKEQGIDESISPNFTKMLSQEKITGLALIVKDGNTKVIENLASTSRSPLKIYRFGSPRAFMREYRTTDGALRREEYLVCITECLDFAGRILKGLPSAVKTQLDTQY